MQPQEVFKWESCHIFKEMSQHIKLEGFIYKSRFPGSPENLSSLANPGLCSCMTPISWTWWSATRLHSPFPGAIIDRELIFLSILSLKYILLHLIYFIYLNHSSKTTKVWYILMMLFSPPISPTYIICLAPASEFWTTSLKATFSKLGCSRSVQPLDGVRLALLNWLPAATQCFRYCANHTRVALEKKALHDQYRKFLFQ